MKYFSLFSGIGGFELGIQKAYENLSNTKRQQQRRFPWNSSNNEQSFLGKEQPTCVGYSEIDKYATQIYQKHFPEHKNYGDIRKINEKELPDFDLLVGGFPCQAFSIAGKRKGFEDTRGTLFFDIARIIKRKRPARILLENVKGLLSHDNGNTFKTIISTLDELGYDLQWQVLNSKNFGVPQNRERVFIVGHLRGTPRPKVFPFRGTNKKDTRNVGKDLSYALDANYSKGTNTLEKGRRQLVQLNQPKHSNDRVYSDIGLSPTLNTMQGGRRQPKVAVPVLTPDRPNKRQNGRRLKTNGEPAFTLTAQDKHGVYDGIKVRRLTPTECCRLQGFPDRWLTGISNSQKYKTLGNAVTVNVIQAITGGF